MCKFPRDIEDFGNEFVKAQLKRHDADYDPKPRFKRSEILKDINAAEDAIKRFSKTPIKDRRAFAVWVTLQKR